ncbi:hypothetical protein LCGC14_0540150 [marine sediment metagenome]|uniref:Uncharacterized protein n=1 Tax=marine sediment metagenome TaxID=412755 RepID=A0A0F9V183_9ZZZZ
MSKVNLVKDNKQFFKQLKKNAIKRETPITIKWARMAVVLGLKSYLQIENKKTNKRFKK